ncbi:MAG: HD domain-containing protein [Gemmatimonadales bacterium]|nr:HD domain-containing protein [Gemmatimonadales bacterium]
MGISELGRNSKSVETDELRLSEIVSALSYSLDLTEGQTMGHSARACIIGMRLVELIGLDASGRSDLFFALLMKDAGCSSNAARLSQLFQADDRLLKREHKLIDWTRKGPAAGYAWRHTAANASLIGRVGQMARIAVTAERIGREMIATRCERGADIAQMVGLSADTAHAIRCLDEHWNGRGHPAGLSGQQIPFYARVLTLAQTFEVFLSERGVAAAFDMARRRSGTWFDPELVTALDSIESDTAFWQSLAAEDPRDLVRDYEPEERVVLADETRVDQVAEAFAIIIDAKSPYTHQHSTGVAAIAVEVGDRMGFSSSELRELRRAALLHDIGKLGVPNTILDKPGKLDDAEWAAMRKHTGYTYEILSRIDRFRTLADVAAAHHERLDGTGYHRGIGSNDLGLAARVLAVADICEALQAERPYRDSLPWDEVLTIMRRLAGKAICPAAFEALATAPPR